MTRILAALGIILLTASVASACGTYVVQSPVVYGPTPVVTNYCAASPCAYTAYSYPVSSCTSCAYTTYAYPYVVARPVVAAPAPVVYGSAYPVTYYYRGPWYVPGQPIRNVFRAAFW
jgi:hypothetical protein